MTRTDSYLQVFAKPSSGLEDEQGLYARLVSEGAEGFKGRKFLRLVGFVKGGNGRGIWNGEGEGNTLMEFNLSIKKPYGFCLTNPQAIEDFHGSLFKADIDTGINTV